MDERTATSADGFAYENAVYRKASKILKKRGKVLLPGEVVPPKLMKHLFGKADLDAQAEARVAFHKAAPEIQKRLAAGEELRSSPHAGFDFVVVDKGVVDGTKPLGKEREIGEAKLGREINANVLGSTLGLLYETLLTSERRLKTWLFSPQPPTARAAHLLDPKGEGAAVFEHVAIAGEKTGVARHEATVAPPAASAASGATRPLIEPDRWQTSAARQVVNAWDPAKDSAQPRQPMQQAIAAMGMGKTVLSLLTLQEAERYPVRLVVCHTIGIAQQVPEEAKKLGMDVTIHDLTSRGGSSDTFGSDAESTSEDGPERSDEDDDDESDEDSEDEDEDAGEPMAEDATTTKRRASDCDHLKDRLGALVAHAKTSGQPVYATITHKMLRAMARVGFDAFGTRMAMVIDEFHLLKRAGDVFKKLQEASESVSTLLVSATPPELLGQSLKEESKSAKKATKMRRDADVGSKLARVPTVVHKPIADGIAHRRLVPLRIESVLAIDEATRELVDPEKTMAFEQRCRAIAHWMVAEGIYAISVFCTRTEHATEAVKQIQEEIKKLVPKAAVFGFAYHTRNGLSAAENAERLATFKDEHAPFAYKFMVSVGQAREGFNMPSLPAVAFLDNPGDLVGVFQGCGRCMRAHKNKPCGRALVFGEQMAASLEAIMRISGCKNSKYVQRGVTPADFDLIMAAVDRRSTEGARVRAATVAAYGRIAEHVEHERKKIVKLVSTAEERMKAKVPAFVAQFGAEAPKKGDGQMLNYVVKEVELAQDAGRFLQGVRENWHVVTQEHYRTTDEQKAQLCALAWFEAPEPPKPKVKLPTGIPDDEIVDARIAAYAAAYGETAPKDKDGQLLGGVVRGVALQPIQAYEWWKSIRSSWHVVKRKCYATTDAQKARLLALPSFTEPELKTESPWVTHMRNGVRQLVATGDWPTQKSGPTGKGLSKWKQSGLPEKNACDAAAAEVLATVADADERAKFQAIYDELTQLKGDAQKRKRAECVAKEAAEKAAKKTRVV